MIRRVLALSLCLSPACVGLYPVGDPAAPSADRPGFALPAVPRAGNDDTGSSGDPDDSGGPDDTDGVDTGGSGTPGELPAGLVLWVDPETDAAAEAADADPEEAALFRKIADNPVAKWLGGWSGDVEVTVDEAVSVAEADGAVRTFVVYNLPNRDCGGYSSGGADDADAYRAWIDGIAAGMAGRTSLVVLEPDGLSMTDCLSGDDEAERYELLTYAVATLGNAGALVYLDAGHSAWHPVDTMVERLLASDIEGAAGFALNTSNFESTDDSVAYGEQISAGTGGARFLVDTARNGLGPTDDHAWCNPDGRALGLPPTLDTGNPLVAGLLWIKTPGESDGSCNGGPSAGTWWPEYALGLAERATW